MDYSSTIKGLFQEISTQKSYSCIHPVLRCLMAILMIPFIVATAVSVAFYYVLLFLRNGSSIAADELEAWLNKRKEGSHFLPEAVLYFVTIPFIFFCRVTLTVFSGILYFTWFQIMIYAYIATLGGIRWQPCLNHASYEDVYTWGFRHSNKTFNVFAFVNLGFILLCGLQALLEHGVVKAWLIILTLVTIYVIYPKLFSKKDMHVLSDPAEIYAVAKSYASVRCVANYKRASALLKKIPDYEDANELIETYDAYVEEKTATGARVGRLLMILLGAIIVALAIVPPVVEKIIEWTEREDLSYYEMSDGTYYVDCDNYEIKSAVIRPRFKDEKVTVIGEKAFDGCDRLRRVEIPSTIETICQYAFRDCEDLEEIVFDGTIDEWERVIKYTSWDENTGDYVITCTDGQLSKQDQHFFN